MCLGTAARADVFEIDGRGAVSVRAGSAAVQWRTPGDRDLADADDGEVLELAPEVPDAAISTSVAPQMPEQWRAALAATAEKYRLSPHLLAALVWQESRWQPAAVSRKGARGLTQLMPSTAHTLAVDARDPAANLEGGAHYLRQMLDLFDGDVERALAAYNAGPGRVQRASGVPRIAETQAYVTTIIDRLTPAAPGLLK